MTQQVTADLARQLADVPLDKGESVTRTLSRCYSVSRLSTVEPPIFYVSQLGGLSGREGVVVYFAAGHWRIAALVTPTESPPGGGEFSVAEPIVVTPVPDGFDLLAKGYIPSAGAGEGRFELFHLGAQASLAWVSPRQYGCGYRSQVLSDDLLLEVWTERTPQPASFADSFFVCPTGWTHEVLWQRAGSTFTQAARRAVPSAGWTLVYFIGALQAGNTALARSYAANDAVVSSTTTFVRDAQVKMPPDLLADEIAEAAAWDALPTNVRGALPRSQRDMDLGAHALRLERVAGVWRVTSVIR